MEEEGLPRRMFQTGFEPTGRKRVHSYFTLRWVESIKPALDEEHLKMLQNSQFSRLMGMGKQTFSVMFVHYLLSRQLVTKKKYELWWLFAGKPIRYGINEFALVTGLNCGTPPTAETSRKRKRGGGNESKRNKRSGKGGGRMWAELFGEFKKPTPAWLLEKLLMGRKYKDPLTRFRLALLLLVEGLLCPTSGTMYLDPEVVEMVSDVEVFLNYPWGRKSFILTVRSSKSRTPAQFVQETTAIQGFPHAMVLLTACCCPEIVTGKLEEGKKFGVGDNLAELVADVVERCSYVNVVSVKYLDQQGQADVRALLNTGVGEIGEEICFPDEENDEEVNHMVALIQDDFPFEHNSWRGGVTADEAEVNGTSLSASGDDDSGEEDDSGGTVQREQGQPSRRADAPAPAGEPERRPEMDRRGGVGISSWQMDEIITRVADTVEGRATAVWEKYYIELKDHINLAVGTLKRDITRILGEGNINSTSAKRGGPTDRLGTPSATPSTSPNKGGGRKVRSVTSAKLREEGREVNGHAPVHRPRTRNQKAAAAIKTDMLQNSESETGKRRTDVRHPRRRGDRNGRKDDRQPINLSSEDEINANEVGATTSEAVSGRNECSSNEDEVPISALIGNRKSVTEEGKISLTVKPPSKVGMGEAMDAGGETAVVGVGNNDVSSIILGSGFQPFKLPGEEAVKAFGDAVSADRALSVINGFEVDTKSLASMFAAADFLDDEKTVSAVVMWIQKRDASSVNEAAQFISPMDLLTLMAEYTKFLRCENKRSYKFADTELVRTLRRRSLSSGRGCMYCPLKVDGRHWVGMIVDVTLGKIFLLDCNTACLAEEELAGYVDPVAQMMPYILVDSTSEGSNVDIFPFPIERVDISFLCEVPALSGIAALILMELHSHNQLAQCEAVSEVDIRAAAMNYAIAVLDTFKNPVQ